MGIPACQPTQTSPTPPHGRHDSDIWYDSIDALQAGGGNPLVRIGVLRLLSTLPDRAVRHSTTDGRPTLTLLAGPAEISPRTN